MRISDVIEQQLGPDGDLIWTEQRLLEISKSKDSFGSKVGQVVRCGFDREVAVELVKRWVDDRISR